MKPNKTVEEMTRGACSGSFARPNASANGREAATSLSYMVDPAGIVYFTDLGRQQVECLPERSLFVALRNPTGR